MTTISLPHASPARAPSPDRFPEHAVGWHLFGRVDELRGGPVSRELFGRRLVAWQNAAGPISVMDAKCAHMGADLARGEVAGDCLRCPFHHWEYGADGRCTRIPAQREIPRFARVRAWPAAQMGPLLFVFNGAEALYPLPFFPGHQPRDFTAAAPFSTTLDCPWYVPPSNAFDRQHFEAAHDRVLAGEPEVTTPAPFCRRASATFKIAGEVWQDRITRMISGPQVTLTCDDWAGTLIFVTARFRRSTSFGMVTIEAEAPRKTRVNVFVWTPNRRNWLGRTLLDPLERTLRRYFIRKFLEADAENLGGCEYQPHRLISADRELAGYFTWLAEVSAGRLPEASTHFHKGNS